mgnify:CR=1 FL=1
MKNNLKGKKVKKRIVLESFFIFFIIIPPFLFKIPDYIPQEPNAIVSILGTTISNNGFPDVSMFFWFIINKVIPLYLLILWFLSSKDWWYHIILIPITMYSFQLFEVFYMDSDEVDTKNILWILPICMVVIPFVYFIRVKIYDKYVHGIDLDAMDKELKELKERERLRNKE